ncbi:SGNH/GDSL hydrolase family protein [Herbiconiux daphne]|uniref:SGNH/GDSL hydrolase family protein n=1 Tax=Herbiconiux daphne TaxID=2970914 RepID=A0ABT2H6P4_9MICO|nr:SGNH/GDSL hydrolase family protein [Herbiconiux daphne]MCS5735582.1 SGNH/GDSL hydrolase family protein [Herbiconiux daphne]
MPNRRPFPRPSVGQAVLASTLAVILACVVIIVGVNLSRVDAGAASNSAPAPYLSAEPTPDRTSTRPRAIFIGDSYVAGSGASADSRKWTSIVSASEGWFEINVGRGGTGYVTTSDVSGCGKQYCPNYDQMVRTAEAANVSIVLVAGGQNDFIAWATNPTKVSAAIAKTYADLREGMPNARIIAVGPSTAGGFATTVVEFDAAVQSAAASVGAEYVSLLDPPVLDPSMLIPDGSQINDAGHAAIAARVLQSIG